MTGARVLAPPIVASRLGEGPMIDFHIVAYLVLGLSLSASALQLGRWLLNADPRAIAAAGRRSLFGLFALAPLVLLWLTLSGRPVLAMTFAAFILPVAVQGAYRWRGLRRLWAPIIDGFAARIRRPGPPAEPRPGAGAAVGRRAAGVSGAQPARARRPGRMAAAEALAVLGLEPQADRGRNRRGASPAARGRSPPSAAAPGI